MRTNINDDKIPSDLNQQQSNQNPQSNQPQTNTDNQDKFKKIVDSTDRELLRITTIFPFDLFPDQIIIDLNKINIIKNDFFFTQKVQSISIQDITDVFVTTSPIFATLQIADNSSVGQPIKTPFLKIKDAYKARRIIQGLVLAKKEQVDISNYKDDSALIDKLEKLGNINT